MATFLNMRMQPTHELQVLPNPAARRALLLGSAIGLGQTPVLSSNQGERHTPLALFVVAALFMLVLIAVS